MRRRFAGVAVLLVLSLVLVAQPAAARRGRPVGPANIQGQVNGSELCPKSICGLASFAGQFAGSVNGANASGRFRISVDYNFLPVSPSDDGTITGGSWSLGTNHGNFSGTVESGGILHANGDNTFNVYGTLDVTSRGGGTIAFNGTLDHNNFPPTVTGDLSS